MNGEKHENYLTNTSLLAIASPVYTTLDGWKEDISGCRDFEKLPEAARRYVEYIEKETGVPVQLIGVGPGRSQTILRGL